MDHGKWTYEQKKQKQEAKANQHVIKVKELKFRPGTEEHDYNFKKDHAIDFLKTGHKVKALVMFKGREIAHADLGKQVLMRLIGDLLPYGTNQSDPKVEGKTAFVIISPNGQK
jgi:translation initiation factor IF-3